jgi:hypothetical protein
MNIYIASSLTHVPKNIFEKYVDSIHSLAKELSSFNVKYALVNSDPQLKDISIDQKAHYCYLWDRKMVEESDLIIAESSFPSTGLGIELQIAENLNIPVIIIFKDFKVNHATPKEYINPDNKTHKLQVGEGFVSLMELGLPNISSVIQYEKKEELFREIKTEIKKIKKAYNNV